MTTRKIQLIAGSTYSISLPKQWVLRHRFKQKTELTLTENANGTLTLSPHANKLEHEKTTINFELYKNSIEQAIFALYYLGVEEITIASSSSFTRQERVRIMQQLGRMSGAEITYEDNKKITIRVLLDKSKINIHQLIYRISLIIDSSIENLANIPSQEEILLNENEIDRLYHLIMKMISLSINDSSILQSTDIKNRILIPSYLLISKKLENIGDNLLSLFYRLNENPKSFPERKAILLQLSYELTRTIRHILGKKEKFEMKKEHKLHHAIMKIRDPISRSQTELILRSIIDIQEEVINIQFYNHIAIDAKS